MPFFFLHPLEIHTDFFTWVATCCQGGKCDHWHWGLHVPKAAADGKQGSRERVFLPRPSCCRSLQQGQFRSVWEQLTAQGNGGTLKSFLVFFFTSFEVFPKSYHVFPVVFLRTSGLLVPPLGTEVTQKISLNFKTWLGGLQF